jgi:hypothetical protein
VGLEVATEVVGNLAESLAATGLFFFGDLVSAEDVGGGGDDVEDPAESVVGVEKVDHELEMVDDAEEHDGVVAARVVGALQQPHGVVDERLEDVFGQKTHLLHRVF